jgi:hypothetical protein
MIWMRATSSRFLRDRIGARGQMDCVYSAEVGRVQKGAYN